MSGWRLATGGRIDRARPVRFTFDGRELTGFAGDTLASALIASGVDVVGRSPYRDRPRGILAAGAEEPNALVALNPDTVPELVRATQLELADGLVAASLSGKGPAPQGVGGRGRHRHAHCEVLVVGGGPAGLAAARTAATTGARVILVDDQAEPGGDLLAAGVTIDGRPCLDWVDETMRTIAAQPESRVLTRATAVGRYDANLVLVVERPAPGNTAPEVLWHIRAERVVLATGATERPIVFDDNDRPGVMLASAARTFVRRFAAAPGHRAVVFTTNDSAYAAAAELVRAGIAVAAVVDTRPRIVPAAAAVTALGVEVLPGHAVVGTRGPASLSGVTVARLADGRTSGPARAIDCDLLAVAGGWNPALQLYSFPGGRLRYDATVAAYLPAIHVPGVEVAGAAAGRFSLAEALDSGTIAGARAAYDTGFAPDVEMATHVVDVVDASPIEPAWFVPPIGAAADARFADQFVDLQRDATVADIQDAIAAGMTYPEHVKRFTTIGTGNDQGRTSGVNEVGILATLLGHDLGELVPTAFRPPVLPIPFGLMAGPYRGELFDPVRPTPAHASHVAAGALFENVGQWKRAWAYPRPGESFDDAVRRECHAVRTGVGIMDVSTLGKIDVQGPDAGVFLDRIYTNTFSTLKVGHSRYGLMCRVDGMVLDDGTTTRLADDRFLMTTTTGNAAAVFDWLEEWSQTEWPELRVRMTSVTDHFAGVAIAGPRSRALLARLAPGLDGSAAAFPFMTTREATVAGMPARIFRISFSGELAYEVYVASWYGRALWDAIAAAGADLDVTPYGTEAMHVLRAEKGYVIVGQETDGTVTPLDLGLDWMVSRKKWFIGRRSLARPAMLAPERRQLVGLLPDDPDELLPEGAPLLPMAQGGVRPAGTAGHVTSSYRSDALGRTFALALLAGGRARIGGAAEVGVDGRVVSAKVVAPVFWDPDNERRDG